MVNYKQTHCGQYEKFGDFFEVYEVITDEMDFNTVLESCKKDLFKKDLPLYCDWHPNIMYKGAKWDDADYYFRGYCTLVHIGDNWKFTVCSPSTH